MHGHVKHMATWEEKAQSTKVRDVSIEQISGLQLTIDYTRSEIETPFFCLERFGWGNSKTKFESFHDIKQYHFTFAVLVHIM